MTLNEEELVVQMQQKQLEMLHELDRVCKKNNLREPLKTTTTIANGPFWCNSSFNWTR